MQVFSKLRERDAWKYFAILHRVDRNLAVAWWGLLILRGMIPALFAVALGYFIGAIDRGAPLSWPFFWLGVSFWFYQVLTPVHQVVSANLGSKTAAWLYDQLTVACVDPPGIGHLEDSALTSDLSMARDFDLGITAPPLAISMDFIASGLVELITGVASAAILFGFAWWAPLVLVTAWGATHWLLRESAVWRDRNTEEVRSAQRHADYAFRLAVDAQSAKEVRLFGLARWIVDRFQEKRSRLVELRWQATRLRERPLVGSLLIVLVGNLLVFGALASSASQGRTTIGSLVAYAGGAITTSLIAFGGLSWALDSAAAPVGAVLRLKAAMHAKGAVATGRRPYVGHAPEIQFRDVGFFYPGTDKPVLDHFNLSIPAGSSLAIVGLNGEGKTTLAKLICRLYDPTEGTIVVDGIPLAELDIESWRSRITAVFQDFIRFELPLSENVSMNPESGPAIQRSLDAAGAHNLAGLDTILSRGYDGGTDLSGGQWQRVALARALCAVQMGAGLVLLDEPTAHLDVRGESEIFERILEATRDCTTILISHRFSTVRHADRICVLEGGRVSELGSHAELMALNGRYKTMFELQAARFESMEPDSDGEGDGYDVLT